MFDRSGQPVFQHTHFQERSDQSKHSLVGRPPCDRRHQFVVIDLIKGTYDTLPVIRTFPRESRLSVLVIRSKVNHSLFLGPSSDTVDCISF
jgi:hypothetical protein